MFHSSYSQTEYEAYQNHHVFEQIKQMMDFYEGISFTCFNYIPDGVSGIGNYASYVYSSLEGTLDSIYDLLKKGHITDAYVLVRKYDDTVLAELYIDVVRKDKFDWMESYIVEDVEEWIKKRHRIPQIKALLDILKQSNSTKDIYPYFGWDTYLKTNRELLDDNVHVNHFNGLLYNCPDLLLSEREIHLKNISILLKQFFTIHLAFIFYLNDHYMMAPDYFDYLDLGMTPPKGCECWISPYAQKAFDTFIKPHTQLAGFIKEHCGLKLE